MSRGILLEYDTEEGIRMCGIRNVGDFCKESAKKGGGGVRMVVRRHLVTGLSVKTWAWIRSSGFNINIEMKIKQRNNP